MVKHGRKSLWYIISKELATNAQNTYKKDNLSIFREERETKRRKGKKRLLPQENHGVK